MLNAGNLLQAASLHSGLISYWPLNDGGGASANDAAPSGSVVDTGSLRNAPAWISGMFGAGVQFNGTSQDILIPNSADMNINSNAVTISAWVKLDKLPSAMTGSYGGVLDSQPDNYVMYMDKGNKELRFKVVDNAGVSTGAHPGIPEAMLNTSDWFHVMGSYDGSQGAVRIYLNGNLVDIGSMPTVVQTVRTGQVSSIGAQPTTASPYTASNFFPGAISDVAVWNRSLGAAEAQYLYNSGTGNAVGAANPDIAALPPLTPALPSVGPKIYYRLDGDLQNYGTGGAALDAVFNDGPDASGPHFATSTVGQGLDLRGNPVSTASTATNGDYLSVGYTLADQGTIALNFQDMDWFDHNTLWANSANANAWESWIYNTGRLSSRANEATNNANLDYFLPLQGANAEAAPHHVAFTWVKSGTTTLNKLYIDGVLREQFVETWRAPGATTYFGGGNTNHLGRGIYDEIRVYEVALSDAEVLYLSQIPEPGVLALLLIATSFAATACRGKRS
ncbi:MAG: laminin G domain-containing protein [Pirellulales bacterium]|nr:laminin G domain-containing protein [Pirellulales bacterium]